MGMTKSRVSQLAVVRTREQSEIREERPELGLGL